MIVFLKFLYPPFACMDSRFALNSQSAAWPKLTAARLLLCSAAWVSFSAHGLEVGAVQMLSGLGQPLSLHLPVRWAAGEARSADCLKVTVEAGERHLSAAELQQSLLKGADANSALIWLRSKSEVVEPVLVLSMGCPAQQLMALVDPVHSMTAPAGGFKTMATEAVQLEPLGPTKETARPIRALKVRAERPTQRSQLRLSGGSLPPLSMADSETPGLRWRFDSDLEDQAVMELRSRHDKLSKAVKDGPFYVRPGAPGASLLMAIDVGRPGGPADLLMAQDGLERLQRAQAQFTSLQAEHLALKAELDKLQAEMAAREASAESRQRWMMVLSLGLAGLVAGGLYLFRRRRDMQPIAPRPANISA
ncbi:hypothetical protein [Roseateles oligotrophus]|uniref:Transmembrane protein n=1 Tax=Roseateles oligotrophus TaxID=1769250 RepID=A0ABT2YIV0_9BURK|nr:hypothetical protein [Roseateles oligotrophus]MCV2369980.1 hypothetical protein [Roseateles oligotrophus]